MAGTEPGERPPDPAGRPGRQLERPPGERYSRSAAQADDDAIATRSGSVLFSAVVKAVVIAAVGSLALFALGALLSSSAGLVFVAGLTGAGVGLVLARASAPGGGHEPALTRGTTIRLAIGVSILAVIVAAVGTWLHALGEGGALGLLDYLLETFGLTVPLELLIATLAAAWGASAGPVQR
jgi:hypothetical protein